MKLHRIYTLSAGNIIHVDSYDTAEECVDGMRWQQPGTHRVKLGGGKLAVLSWAGGSTPAMIAAVGRAVNTHTHPASRDARETAPPTPEPQTVVAVTRKAAPVVAAPVVEPDPPRDQELLHGRPAKTYTAEGVTLSLMDWAERLGVARTAIDWRLKSGKPFARVVAALRAKNAKRTESTPPTLKDNALMDRFSEASKPPTRLVAEAVRPVREIKQYTAEGRTMGLEQWADTLKCDRKAIEYRLGLGQVFEGVVEHFRTRNARKAGTYQEPEPVRPAKSTAIMDRFREPRESESAHVVTLAKPTLPSSREIMIAVDDLADITAAIRRHGGVKPMIERADSALAGGAR